MRFVLFIFALLPSLFVGSTKDGGQIGKTQENNSKAVNLITNNLKEFVSRYQSLTGDYSFNPKYVEAQHSVYLIDEDKEGTFIDFNDQQGHVLVDDEFKIYDIKSEGQVDYFTTGEEVYYSSYSGYSYYNGEKLVPFSMPQEEQEEEIVRSSYGVANYTASNEKNIIVDYNYYMNKRYGSAYKNVKNNVISDTTNVPSQWDLSIYSLGYGSEGNCGLAALYYSLELGYYRFNNIKYAGFSEKKVKFSAKENDSFRDSILWEGRKYNVPFISDVSRDSLYPESYIEIRQWLVKNAGYKVSGTTSSQISKCLKAIVKEKTGKSISVTAKKGAQIEEIKKAVDTSCFPLIGVYDDIWYNHFMTITGYRYYEKVEKFWIFTLRTKVMLLQLADFHNLHPVYMDYTKYLPTYYFDTEVVLY